MKHALPWEEPRRLCHPSHARDSTAAHQRRRRSASSTFLRSEDLVKHVCPRRISSTYTSSNECSSDFVGGTFSGFLQLPRLPQGSLRYMDTAPLEG
ncbi:hypothetical protein KOW79_022620 [Hemibagrus wyckioides]|uniref:Uncharacterized protein n=1 Tax=Hemibagrus wyckioides TaxID=337641 RepID=A0A9D3N165_9TELE|nr:hypothetical protein KOW79_022620 [Hemibagrus wyckioides]